jgi:aerobic-type carbon monoxide dehydrogenase small subunit (CoxS/CutS family)
MPETIAFRLNGQSVQLDVDPERPLLWVLRTDLALTGTKFGCGANQCGTCTVLVDNEAVRSCSETIGSVRGRDVVTIEGLERDGVLHPLQEAFMAHDALQCGFCTPGMILTAHALLRRHPQPSREQVVEGMNQNLCRCGAHPRIVDAILEAATALQKGVRS